MTIEKNKNFIRRQVQGILEPIVEQASAPPALPVAPPALPVAPPALPVAKLALTTTIIQKVVDDICNEVEIQAPSLPPGGSMLGSLEDSSLAGAGNKTPEKRKPEEQEEEQEEQGERDNPPPNKRDKKRSRTPDFP